MSKLSRLESDIEARKLLEERWPQACDSKKRGEYNMLRCCAPKDHAGEHCYVVDHANDYPKVKTK